MTVSGEEAFCLIEGKVGWRIVGAPTYSLQGKTVLITGAARGIGAEAARQTAARGARVSLVGLEPDELRSVARECGEKALWFEADVTDAASLESAVNGTVEQVGGIDVVIANAGIAAGGPMRYMEEETFRAVIEVNLMGVWRTLRLTLPHVIERRGYLLPVASMAAIVQPFPGFTPYSTSKAGVEAMARCVRVETAHLGVDVGIAYFGWIDTDMTRGGDEHPAFTFMRSRLKGPLGKTRPVSKAGAAIVAGIEKRAKVVAEPPFVRVLDKARGLVANAVEREVKKHVPEAMAHFEAERRQTGDAMARPVGAGGRAASAAARSAGAPEP
jgi:NAD(P)-dependent dehydrogenase (short-subunit alcohol dehydrogenase family)